jgi:endogenous inhibitor of DNA gyrase (YacG/DUF329 family)
MVEEKKPNSSRGGGERVREMSSFPPPAPPLSPPSSPNCTYCGEPIKWHFHEEYAGWRSVDPETGEEHECDPSSMLKTMTVDMANCKRCGKLVRWGPPPELEDAARAYEIHIYPDVEHRCHHHSSQSRFNQTG